MEHCLQQGQSGLKLNVSVTKPYTYDFDVSPESCFSLDFDSSIEPANLLSKNNFQICKTKSTAFESSVEDVEEQIEFNRQESQKQDSNVIIIELQFKLNEATNRINQIKEIINHYPSLIKQCTKDENLIKTASLETQILIHLSTKDLVVRWLEIDDLKSIIDEDLLPNNTKCSNLQTLRQLRQCLQNNCQNNKPSEENTKSIVIEYKNQIVGTGLLKIGHVQYPPTGKISLIMTNKKYPSQSQLQHLILFTLESLAWHNQCHFVAISQSDLSYYKNVAEDLDYRIKGCGSMKWFLKYQN